MSIRADGVTGFIAQGKQIEATGNSACLEVHCVKSYSFLLAFLLELSEHLSEEKNNSWIFFFWQAAHH